MDSEYKREIKLLKKKNPDAGHIQIDTFGTKLRIESSDNQIKVFFNR